MGPWLGENPFLFVVVKTKEVFRIHSEFNNSVSADMLQDGVVAEGRQQCFACGVVCLIVFGWLVVCIAFDLPV